MGPLGLIFYYSIALWANRQFSIEYFEYIEKKRDYVLRIQGRLSDNRRCFKGHVSLLIELIMDLCGQKGNLRKRKKIDRSQSGC